ncbi:hypothetical protein OUZ56_016185 [Daphnia magna]|uniref:Uncharacterized protein n=1 Tax=Daphnia magna TaxID=35525 RepID=A0ABR0APX4_9CRUS|nr:hypothetical protein OUZ56_016185 [Daphnia magna]
MVRSRKVVSNRGQIPAVVFEEAANSVMNKENLYRAAADSFGVNITLSGTKFEPLKLGTDGLISSPLFRIRYEKFDRCSSLLAEEFRLLPEIRLLQGDEQQTIHKQ